MGSRDLSACGLTAMECIWGMGAAAAGRLAGKLGREYGLECNEASISRVSGSDTPQEGWTDTEWAVFFAWAIMFRAGCVSREDLHLLRDILACCGGEMARTAI